MPQFPASIDLYSLDGTNGFRVNAEAAYDRSGFSVASAGDINGDGFGDLIIGAPYADPNGASSGAAYVVFGAASGLASDLSLSSLNGSNGFKLNGAAAGDKAGWSVASAGDINGDGFDDLFVGAPNANGATGAAYVMFGKASGFSPAVDLSGLNGGDGFRLNGAAAGDKAGYSVSSAGDVNGDGVDDLILGASHSGGSPGASYVVFGETTGFSASLNLSGLSGVDGFKISGANSDFSGSSVASAGDVNGDGFDDLIVSATGNHRAYIVFGKAAGFASNLNLSSLGAGGFTLTGAYAFAVSAGDINGDGLSDLIVSDPFSGSGNATYVVFGSVGLGADIDLTTLNGTNGFRISGGGARTGYSVAGAGDLNGDGFGDLIIGAPTTSVYGYGAAYVLFGSASGFSANVDPTALTGADGFRIDGQYGGDRLGNAVASAGDVNGDGFEDVIVGAQHAHGFGPESGRSFVVFGRAPTAHVGLLGSSVGQYIHGGSGDDSLTGLGGDDTLEGGAGNDILRGDPGADVASYAHASAGVTVSLALTGAQNTGGAGNDSLTSMEGLIGSAFNDTLTGDDRSNTLRGGAGNDMLDGGAGTDEASYADALSAVQVNLGLAGPQTTGGAGTDTLTSIENLLGSRYGDTLTGDAGANFLLGSYGDDMLNGGTATTAWWAARAWIRRAMRAPWLGCLWTSASRAPHRSPAVGGPTPCSRSRP